MTTIVKMEGITKSFGSLMANEQIDFTLEEGETHALVGENGAGKTTLMRILYGQYTQDEGDIYIYGKKRSYNISGALKLGIGMVHQNFMQISKMTILENIILGHAPRKANFIDYKTARKTIKELLQRLGMTVSPDVLISTLSVGERQKIEIIKALYYGAKILILDEPTAVLTPQESNELFLILEELKKENKSIIYISHKLKEVITVADRITVMRKGRVVSRFKKGEVKEVDIARAMIGKQDVQIVQNTKDSVIGQAVLQASGLWYFNQEGLPKLRNFSFEVRQGEILGIGGVEGNGQSELISLLMGTLMPSSGKIVLQGIDITCSNIRTKRDLGLGYIPEDRMTVGLALEAKVDENLICGAETRPPFSRYAFLLKKPIEAYMQKMVDDFDIRGITKEKPVKSLSGGNMQKIVLAREIGRTPKVLIASQPTRGLDIGAINFVRNHLLEQRKNGTAVILVSADLEELMTLSDRLIIMYEGECSGEITDVTSVTEEDIGLLMGGITKAQSEVLPHADQ